MRRYDAAYRQVKAALDAGTVGEALMVHAVHRNAERARTPSPPRCR